MNEEGAALIAGIIIIILFSIMIGYGVSNSYLDDDYYCKGQCDARSNCLNVEYSYNKDTCILELNDGSFIKINGEED